MKSSSIVNDISQRFSKDKKTKTVSNNDYKYSIKNLQKQPKTNETQKPKPKGENLSHVFYFESWNHSLRVKFMAEAIFVILITICLFISIRYALDISRSIDSLDESYLLYTSQLEKGGLATSMIASLRQQQQQVWSQILSETKIYLGLVTQIWIYWILMTPFLLKDIQQIVYAHLRMKASSYSSGVLIISLINVALAGELTYRIFFDFKSAVSVDHPNYDYQFYKAWRYESTYWSLQHSFGTLLAFQFIRVFLFLIATKAFGPMLHIIISMHIEVIKISLIELSIIIVFFCFGRAWFYTIPEFDSDIHAFSTLLQVSLGNIDMTIFDNPNIKFSKYYGYFYLYTFICLSTVTLLNFVVGIITNIYDAKSRIGIGLYLKTVISMRKVYGSDDKYSSIAFMVPPLNVITFVLTPVVAWIGSKKLNDAMLHLCFIPIMIAGAAVFASVSLLLCPIAYFITIEKLIRRSLLSGKINNTSISTNLADLVLFIFWGGFILFGQVVVDTRTFVSELYEDNLAPKFKAEISSLNPKVRSQLDPRFFRLFVSFLKKQTESSVSSKLIIKNLQKVLKIEAQIHNLLYVHSTDPQKSTKK